MGSKLTTSGATNSGVPNKIWGRTDIYPASSLAPVSQSAFAPSHLVLSYLQFLHGFKPPGQTKVNDLNPVSRLGQTQDVLGLKMVGTGSVGVADGGWSCEQRFFFLNSLL